MFSSFARKNISLSMHITLIEPFFTGSHQQWAEGFQKHSQHEVQILSLKGRYWKWRMFGGAVTLAKIFKESVKKTDLILVSDMLDLTTFLGLTRDVTNGIPTAIYFHENQLTYPWSPTDKDVKLGRNNEYAFMNYTSALAADKLFFNSQYHLHSFIDALPAFLKQFPDYRELQNIDIIKKKSEVLYLGIDLKRFDEYEAFELSCDVPVILWNHRWEYDKNPDNFFRLLFQLKENGIPFQLVVLGESYARFPKIFDEAKERLKDEIIHFGFADTFEDYARWLKTADVLPVTSNQDFFGGSVVEAMYCGVLPLLPNRLAYPEHIPGEYRNRFVYDFEKGLYDKLEKLLLKNDFSNRSLFTDFVEKYDWNKSIDSYDNTLLD
jgi:glycosyltransferase involved in cell wall biosynthesis